MSHTEKDLAEDSQDEDSGHDSADSFAVAPVDDRERIVHLETAVAWIREEMVGWKTAMYLNIHTILLSTLTEGVASSLHMYIRAVKAFCDARQTGSP